MLVVSVVPPDEVLYCWIMLKAAMIVLVIITIIASYALKPLHPREPRKLEAGELSGTEV
jgi:hypothetical protein